MQCQGFLPLTNPTKMLNRFSPSLAIKTNHHASALTYRTTREMGELAGRMILLSTIGWTYFRQ